MKLLSFRITDYRCIDDTGEIAVDPKVTCLVGKNEAGKTGVLQGLRRANPVHSASFDLVRDYPRMRLRQHQRDRKEAVGPAPTVVRARFALDDDDVRVVEAELGAGSVADREFVLSAGYEGEPVGTVRLDGRALVRHLLVDTPWAARTAELESLDALGAALDAAGEDETAAGIRPRLQAARSLDPVSRAWKALGPRTPRFLYFDDYAVMKGKAALHALRDDGAIQNDDGLRTLKDLLDLAGTTPGELLDDGNYEQHKAQLEATANDITREVFEYWRQNPELEVEFDVHRPQGDTPSTFHVRIKNRRHGVTVPFDERSRGFVWFFSFLVAFNKVVSEGKPLVILLDEPGLNLHGKAQADLLRFIEARLATHYQVLYSTHSPFMVDPLHLERVRTVEDVAGRGTKVSADCLSTDADTLFPLQAALGYDVAQSLFVGPHCLLVEGPSDLLYLRALSRLAAAADKPSLDDRWVITPVGGADKIGAFVALMGGNKLNLAVLIDVTKQDKQRIDQLIARRLLDATRLIRVSQFTSQSDADIEDLLPPTAYVAAARAELGPKGGALELATLPPGPRVVKRIEAALGHRFDHYAVAIRMVRHLETEGCDDPTIERFARLFETVNAILPRKGP